MLETKHYKVDFSTVKNERDIHSILNRSLNFFDYCENLDSLYDCLTNMLCHISIIEIHGIEKLKKFGGYDRRLLEIFYDAKHDWGENFSRRFIVTIVHADGTREPME